MANHIVVIISDFKGTEFIDEAHNAGWAVTMVTRKKLLDKPWPWTSINDTRTVSDDADVMEYVRAVTNVLGSSRVDRVVGLDEFDVLTAAMAREHLNMPGMTRSFALRFRDKYTMRNVARAAGVPCPEFTGVFNADEISEYLATTEAPWVIKPRHEVSAFGIRKCETADEVWGVLNELDARNSWRDHPSQFLIERFIEGDVYHVDSVVESGKVVACGVSQYGTTPFKVSHHGGVFTSSIVKYGSKERKALEKMNVELLAGFEYDRGVTHAEFLQSSADGKFYLLEVACRVGGAYIANVLEYASNFNLWREWAKLEVATAEQPYKLPKLRKEYAGITLALANTDQPDTSHYTDEEIVYKVDRPKHVGLIFQSANHARVTELMDLYTQRISDDFLMVAPVKERHDD